MPRLPDSASSAHTAIRSQYDKHGAREFYENFGSEYRNPHEPVICELLAAATIEWNLDLADKSVLDLACGSGEVTLALRELGCSKMSGIDPYTGNAYLERTGQQAEEFSFADIACGAFQSRKYDLCVCSFAMHLAPPSLLPQLCLQLSLCSRRLLILTPHKRPHISLQWGWSLTSEILLDRVRARLYESANFDAA